MRVGRKDEAQGSPHDPGWRDHADLGQQAAWDHRNRTITENMIGPDEMTRIWTDFEGVRPGAGERSVRGRQGRGQRP
jgi:hypothetical protein